MNLANKLTMLRVILVPIFLIFLIGKGIPYGSIIATLIFIIASFTDYLDGYIARKKKQVTNFGKFSDAIADKVLVNSVLIIFASQGFIPAIVPVVIIVRDIVVDAIRMNVAEKGVVQAAKMSGKIKTASLMIGIILTFFYNLPFELFNLDIASFLLVLATIFAIISGIQYYIMNKDIIFSKEEISDSADKKTQK